MVVAVIRPEAVLQAVDFVEMIRSNAAFLAVLCAAIGVVVKYQRGLNYREARAAHVTKSRAFAFLESLPARATVPGFVPVLGGKSVPLNPDELGRSLINEKGYRDEEDEYEGTLDATPKEVVKTIWPPFGPHMVATTKRRVTPHGSQLSFLQLRYVHPERYQRDGDEELEKIQTEVYLFDNGDGTTDVYVHVETVVEDPEGHLTDKQVAGDEFGAFWEAYNGGSDVALVTTRSGHQRSAGRSTVDAWDEATNTTTRVAAGCLSGYRIRTPIRPMPPTGSSARSAGL